MVKYTPIMPVRRYQRFHGSNRFYCGGRLVSANQIGILIFVAVVIIVTACLFLAFDSRFLITVIPPTGVGVIFPIIGLLFTFYSLSFLFKTGCTDPGIIPRSLPDEIAYNSSLGDEDPTTTAKGFVGLAGRYKTVVVRGQQIKLKWCPTCNIWRPPRASHCGLCNNCLEVFDHHCPVVGNCVAKRNYRYFYLFVSTVCIGCLYTMGCNIAVIVVASKRMGFGDALKNYPASVIEFGIAGLSAVSVSGLAAMHSWLIARMQTTNEDLKGTFNPRRQGTDVRNPYQRGNCCLNFISVICGPFHPSLIDSRGIIDESLLTMEEESATEGGGGGGGGYGATSAVPKLPPDSPERMNSPTSWEHSAETKTQSPHPSPTHPTSIEGEPPADPPVGLDIKTKATIETSLSLGPSDSGSVEVDIHVDSSGGEDDPELKNLI